MPDQKQTRASRKPPTREHRCDLAVVGAGICGLAAAWFAAARGIDTALAGTASALQFSSGFIDLLGVHPMESGRTWSDPWRAIDALRKDRPDHPYARIASRQIRNALESFFTCLDRGGLPYMKKPERNVRMPLSTGSVKLTYGLPRTMWPAVAALKEKQPCLIMGIQNLRGFSARQIVETLKPSWKNLTHAQVIFPGSDHLSEVYPERMAAFLALEKNREDLAAAVRPHLNEAEVVGFPAIFGIHNSIAVASDIQAKIGRPVFEIPTMPPSIPGVRIKETLEQQLRGKGVVLFYPKKVVRTRISAKTFVLEIQDNQEICRVRANAVILATGRFLGKGLATQGSRIKETLFDLPVYQPEPRHNWHRRHFLDPRGHGINLAGLETDAHLRPIQTNGRPVHPNLYAAGSILAHQDWMRMKCGAGLAIATAYAAVNALSEAFSA